MKSNTHVLVEHKQIALSGENYMKVQLLSYKIIYLFYYIVTVKTKTQFFQRVTSFFIPSVKNSDFSRIQDFTTAFTSSSEV